MFPRLNYTSSKSWCFGTWKKSSFWRQKNWCAQEEDISWPERTHSLLLKKAHSDLFLPLWESLIVKVLGLLCELINDILLFFQRIEPQCECFCTFCEPQCESFCSFCEWKVFVLLKNRASMWKFLYFGKIDPQCESQLLSKSSSTSPALHHSQTSSLEVEDRKRCRSYNKIKRFSLTIQIIILCSDTLVLFKDTFPQPSATR